MVYLGNSHSLKHASFKTLTGKFLFNGFYFLIRFKF